MMNQPPDDNFYNSSTDNTNFPPQQRPGQAPGYPQRPQAAPNNYPQQGPQGGQPGPVRQQGPVNPPGFGQPFPQAPRPGFGPQNAPQGPVSQPGFGPQNAPQRPVSQPGFGPQNAPQGPVSQPGFGPQNAPQGPVSQPGFGPPNFTNSGPAGRQNPAAQNAGGFGQQRQQGFPPPSGPISQPGFSTAGRPQNEDQYATEATPWPGTNTPGGNSAPPWESQPSARPQSGATPWGQPQQQPGAAPWGQPPAQPNATPWNQQQQGSFPANGQNQAPPESIKPKKARLGLMITLVVIALLIVGGTSGIFFWRSHGSNAASITPTTQGTNGTSGVTPVATTPTGTTPTTSNTFHSIGTPVQAGTDWIVTVTGVKETTASLFAPNSGNTYLEISLSLKNISGNTLQLVSYLEFTLSDGRHETASDTNIHRPPDGNVNSNQTLNAQIAFEVPKSQHSFVFNFAYGLRSNTNGIISWQLTV